jgi:two-component system, NarL family, response regulator NreC
MIKVVVADDHYLVRQGVRALLDNAEEIEVVGEAENGEEALRLVEELNPDVVVMDISMPEMDGIKATEKIHAMPDRHTRVVILSMYANVDLVEQALKKGATGYLLKRSTTTELVQAVVAANQGKRFLSSALGNDIPHV